MTFPLLLYQYTSSIQSHLSSIPHSFFASTLASLHFFYSSRFVELSVKFVDYPKRSIQGLVKIFGLIIKYGYVKLLSLLAFFSIPLLKFFFVIFLTLPLSSHFIHECQYEKFNVYCSLIDTYFLFQLLVLSFGAFRILYTGAITEVHNIV